jgi:hypothetical protein
MSAENVAIVENIITYVFLPGCCMKQVVNFAQWWNAASNLAKADRENEKKTKSK